MGMQMEERIRGGSSRTKLSLRISHGQQGRPHLVNLVDHTPLNPSPEGCRCLENSSSQEPVVTCCLRRLFMVEEPAQLLSTGYSRQNVHTCDSRQSWHVLIRQLRCGATLAWLNNQPRLNPRGVLGRSPGRSTHGFEHGGATRN